MASIRRADPVNSRSVAVIRRMGDASVIDVPEPKNLGRSCRVLWQRTFVATWNWSSAVDLAIDSAGNGFIAGSISIGSIDFGSSDISLGAFLVNSIPEGEHLWSK